MVEEKDHLQERGWLELVQRHELYGDEWTYLISRTDFDAGGSEVFTSGTDEESAGAGAGNGADNDTDSGRGIVLESVIRRCWEKYGTDSKNVRSVDTKYFLMEGL